MAKFAPDLGGDILGTRKIRAAEHDKARQDDAASHEGIHGFVLRESDTVQMIQGGASVS